MDDQQRAAHRHAGEHVDEHGVRGEGVVQAHDRVAAGLHRAEHVARLGHVVGPPEGEPCGGRRAGRGEGAGAPVVHQHAPRHASQRRLDGGPELLGRPGRPVPQPVGLLGRELVEGEAVDRRVAPDLLALGGEGGRLEGLVTGGPPLAQPARPGQAHGRLGAERVQGQTSFGGVRSGCECSPCTLVARPGIPAWGPGPAVSLRPWERSHTSSRRC